MQNIIPMLAYENGITAVEWLVKAFDFQENESMRMMDGERLTHAELKLNDNIIMLATPSPDYESINKHRNHCEQMNKWLSVPYVSTGYWCMWKMLKNTIKEQNKTARKFI
jgi:PhnB protein